MTEEAFFKRIKQLARQCGSYILGVYRALDEAAAEDKTEPYKKFACGAGCAQCCYQAVTCTEPEFMEIARYIDALPVKQRSRLLNTASKRSWAVYTWMKEKELLGTIATTVEQTIHMNEFTDGKPCPFLQNDNTCGIYPVRPIDCRNHHSITRCESIRWPDIRKNVTDYELWAAHALNEFARKTCGLQVQPVHFLFLQWRQTTKARRQ